MLGSPCAIVEMGPVSGWDVAGCDVGMPGVLVFEGLVVSAMTMLELARDTRGRDRRLVALRMVEYTDSKRLAFLFSGCRRGEEGVDEVTEGATTTRGDRIDNPSSLSSSGSEMENAPCGLFTSLLVGGFVLIEKEGTVPCVVNVIVR